MAAAASRELELGSEIAVDALTSSCLDPAKACPFHCPSTLAVMLLAGCRVFARVTGVIVTGAATAGAKRVDWRLGRTDC